MLAFSVFSMHKFVIVLKTKRRLKYIKGEPMKEFISYERENPNYIMNDYERFLPIILLIVILFLLFIFKKKIRLNNKFERRLRYFFAGIIIIVTSLFYLGNWIIKGLTINKLPLHLCYICNVLCAAILIKPNKKIFNFLLFAGVLGGISSILSMDKSMSSRYLKYYYFMVAHLSIIIVPIYLSIINKWFISKLELLRAYLILQVMGLSMGIINSIYKTDYFFVSFTSNIAAKGTILEDLGTGYDYFIKLEFLSLIYFIVWYISLTLYNSKFFSKKHKKIKSN